MVHDNIPGGGNRSYNFLIANQHGTSVNTEAGVVLSFEITKYPRHGLGHDRSPQTIWLLHCVQHKQRYGAACFYFIAWSLFLETSRVWRVGLCICIEYVNACFRPVGWLVGGQVRAFSDSRILKIINLVTTRASCSAPHRSRGDGQTDAIVYNTCINSHISSVIPDVSGPFVFQPSHVRASDPRPDRTELGRDPGTRIG